jgi:hypothetical protein
MTAATEAAPAISPRTGLVLVLIGAALFLALLWMIGTGNGLGNNSNDGGSHAGGKGLNGFAGLVRLAAADGWTTTLARSDFALDQPGLLVLTPEATAPGKDIARIVRRHRRVGPVLVIAPKWVVQRLSAQVPGAQDGWVALVGVQTPVWPKFLDQVNVSARNGAHGAPLRWRAAGLSGRLPDASAIEAGSGTDDAGQPLIPLVRFDNGDAGAKAPILAAYVATARPTPALDRLALDGGGVQANLPTSTEFPLVLVFEPDLLDNYGMADPANAALASRLLAAAGQGVPRAITFDLTLDGLGHAPNLLTLAFTPPYLAATLCLILAAFAAGWRSFCRFGAARTRARELAFGKTPLVTNSGALIVRARRLHLLGPPYVAASRERIVRALALARHADPAATDAAIDRALAFRTGGDAATRGFAETAQSLHQARGQTAIVAAARALHALERTLIR